MVVEVAFYAIQRRYQIENLHTFDKEEWPRLSDLIDYRSKMPRDVDYYRPNDYFLALGEWLHDASERRKANAAKDRAAASQKK